MTDHHNPSDPTHKTTFIDQGGAEVETPFFGELGGGQYWRAKADIPVVRATQTSWSKGVTETDGRDAVSVGTALLVKSLRWVDGELHTVILAPHPSEPHDTLDRRFLRDEFFALFSYVEDPVAARGSEIAALESEMHTLRTEMLAGPPGLPALSAPKSAPSIGAMVANAEQVEGIRANAVAIHDIAQKRAVFVQEKNKQLSGCVSKLARFHQEQATAALAAVEDTLRMAENLQSGVQTLGLYTGEDVRLVQLCDGEGADGALPLHLYQRKLYMDEEWLVHALNGGADADDIGEFGKALSADRALLERIMPAQRSVVLMAYRRLPKEYYTANGANLMMSAMANAMANAEKGNKDTFLLIRNGDQVWQVFSDVATQAAERLFPTALEVEAIYKIGGDCFRGIDASKITAADLRYTDRRAKHDELALFYKRLLVLLWGLDHRLGLFGDFYDRVKWPSWLAIGFQHERFVFISDDEGALEDHSHPDLNAFAASANDFVQPGSRVAAVWRKLMTSKTAPGAVKNGRYHDGNRDYNVRTPVEPTGIGVVGRRGQDSVMTTPCVDHDGKVMNVAVSLTALAEKERSRELGMLCLDTVRAADLDYYINSRRHRTNYLDYVPLFVAARDQLRREEVEAAPFVASLRDGLVAGGFASDESAETALAAAIRLWRAGAYGRPVPVPGDKGYKAALKAIGVIAYALLGRPVVDVAAVTAAADIQGRRPLRLVIDKDGTLALYAAPRAEEEMDLGVPHPWVARMTVAVNKGLPTLGAHEWVVLGLRATEVTVRSWPDEAAWVDRITPEAETWVWEEKPRYSHDDMARLWNWLSGNLPEIAALLPGAPPPSKELRATLSNKLEAAMLATRSGYYDHPRACVPLALVALDHRSPDDRKNSPNRPYSPYVHLLYIGADAIGLLGAGEGGPEAVEQWLKDVYMSPGAKLQELKENGPPSPKLGLFKVRISGALRAYQPPGVLSELGQRWRDGVPSTVAELVDGYQLDIAKNGGWHSRSTVRLLRAAPWAEALLARLA